MGDGLGATGIGLKPDAAKWAVPIFEPRFLFKVGYLQTVQLMPVRSKKTELEPKTAHVRILRVTAIL